MHYLTKKNCEKLGPGLVGKHSILSAQSEQLWVKKVVIVKRKGENLLTVSGMKKRL